MDSGLPMDSAFHATSLYLCQCFGYSGYNILEVAEFVG